MRIVAQSEEGAENLWASCRRALSLTIYEGVGSVGTHVRKVNRDGIADNGTVTLVMAVWAPIAQDEVSRHPKRPAVFGGSRFVGSS